MRCIAILSTIAVAVSATVAQAAPEARNPFHCSIALEASYERAKERLGGEDALTKDLHTRYVWQAFAAAMFPKRIDYDAEATELRAAFAADPATAMAMAEACMKRQDVHPKFQAARLEAQSRPGVSREPISASASIEGLKGLFAAK